MERRLKLLLITITIAVILFISLDTYPAIRMDNVECGKDITDNKTEEMLQEFSEHETKKGMSGELATDMEKALMFSSGKETIRVWQERLNAGD